MPESTTEQPDRLGWEVREVFGVDFLARLERLGLMAKRLAASPSAGRRRAKRVGDGLEIADARPYAPGDDVRFIDWSYYARTDRLARRLFHEHSEAGVAALLDASASMAAAGAAIESAETGAFDYARQVTGALAFVAMSSLERVVVQPFADGLGQPIVAGRHPAAILPVLTALARLQPGGATRLAESVRRFVLRQSQPTTVLIVSDLLDCIDDLPAALEHLRQAGCDTTVCHIVASCEARPARQGAVRLRAAETGQSLDVEITSEVLAAYRDQWDAFIDACRRVCLARGAIYVAATSDVPLERFVLRSLRQAGVLVG